MKMFQVRLLKDVNDESRLVFWVRTEGPVAFVPKHVQ